MCVRFNKHNFTWTACLLKMCDSCMYWDLKSEITCLSPVIWHGIGEVKNLLSFTFFFLFVLQVANALVCPVAAEADNAYFCKIFFTAELPQFFFFLHWLYGPCRTLASFRINFQASVPLAVFFQRTTPHFCHIILNLVQPSLYWISSGPFSFWGILRHFLCISFFWYSFHMSRPW